MRGMLCGRAKPVLFDIHYPAGGDRRLDAAIASSTATSRCAAKCPDSLY